MFGHFEHIRSRFVRRARRAAVPVWTGFGSTFGSYSSNALRNGHVRVERVTFGRMTGRRSDIWSHNGSKG
eukprot:2365228-Pyramimonas_sp.AAC.1